MTSVRLHDFPAAGAGVAPTIENNKMKLNSDHLVSSLFTIMGSSSSKEGEGVEGENAGEEPKQQQMGYMEMISTGYKELVNAIIRPPRATYEIPDLG